MAKAKWERLQVLAGERLEAIAGSAEGLLWGAEAGGEERVERQTFQDRDGRVCYIQMGQTQKKTSDTQEGGATGAGTLSQPGGQTLWSGHQWPLARAAGRYLWAVGQGWAAVVAEARAGISPWLLCLLGGVGGENKS